LPVVWEKWGTEQYLRLNQYGMGTVCVSLDHVKMEPDKFQIIPDRPASRAKKYKLTVAQCKAIDRLHELYLEDSVSLAKGDSRIIEDINKPEFNNPYSIPVGMSALRYETITLRELFRALGRRHPEEAALMGLASIETLAGNYSSALDERRSIGRWCLHTLQQDNHFGLALHTLAGIKTTIYEQKLKKFGRKEGAK